MDSPNSLLLYQIWPVNSFDDLLPINFKYLLKILKRHATKKSPSTTSNNIQSLMYIILAGLLVYFAISFFKQKPQVNLCLRALGAALHPPL